MPQSTGPIRRYALEDGTDVPFYAIKFDKNGNCTSPRSLSHLVGALAAGEYTDVHIFSHGWNNTPKDALANYEKWIEGYAAMRAEGGYGNPDPYRPILIGVIWPSVWIVPWWERGPKIAAAGEEDLDGDMIEALAEHVAPGGRQAFYDLVDREELDEVSSRRFLEILSPLFAASDPDSPEDQAPTVDDLLDAWSAIATAATPTPFQPEDDERELRIGGDTAESPEAAGAVARAPLDGVRMASVWQMKDRAGRVGSNGVHALLGHVLEATKQRPGQPAAHVHLIGHSYGAKVLLSALCDPVPVLPRNATSMLLLQPAINYLAFAEVVPGTDGRAGGYRRALDLVDLPILTTFTNQDSALRNFFHLALRRSSDLGEPSLAADPDDPPSRYAALGGYGPGGLAGGEAETLDALQPGHAYALGRREIYGIRSHGKITSHGDISNPYTYWALFSLVKAAR